MPCDIAPVAYFGVTGMLCFATSANVVVHEQNHSWQLSLSGQIEQRLTYTPSGSACSAATCNGDNDFIHSTAYPFTLVQDILQTPDIKDHS